VYLEKNMVGQDDVFFFRDAFIKKVIKLVKLSDILFLSIIYMYIPKRCFF